jgi:hypothetical protein
MNMNLGGRGRFSALESKLAARPGVTNPGGLAAAIGRKKYGAKGMAALSHHGEGGAPMARHHVMKQMFGGGR